MSERGDSAAPGEDGPSPDSTEARALSLYTRSLAVPDSERDAWIRARCGDDGDLLDAVLRLEAADRAAGDAFLQSPLAALSAGAERVGERFGAFEATGLLGSGGMGQVYHGRRVRGDFEQEVAIKCFDARFASAEARARFEVERQVLAALEHPAIARVIDGGATQDGTPYLVMELVRGQPLNAYCDDRGLDLNARLALFRRVCAAIQFAHDAGIVHRDLKPGNVLVTDAGDPKVIDFGIAKVLRPELVAAAAPETRVSALPMTPEYASPEQVRGGDIGPASDVYSLGVILYELLSGSKPYHFAAFSPATIERTVCDVVPANPSETVDRRRSPPPEGLGPTRGLGKRLRGDLDRIVMTALRKEPERRYPSPAALSDDIERHLGGHPVWARGASRTYRLAKFVQRNRAASLALVTVLATLVVALAVVLDRAAETERQRDAAQREAARSAAARDFLVELIGRSDPFENSESATLAGALRQSVPGMAERFEGKPALEAEMRYAIGYALQNLGEIPLARAQMERALALWEQHGDDLDRAQARDGLGIVAWWESDFEQGEAQFAEALSLLGDDRSSRGLLLRINALNNLAGMRSDAGAYAASLEASGEALRLAEDPAIDVDPETLASIWGNRANALGSIEGREGESIEAFERALALQEASTGDMHPNYAIILNNLAMTHYALGDLDEMAALFERSLAIRRATLGPDHPQTATALFNLAAGQVAAGQFEAAEPNALEALAVARNGYEPGHPRIGKAHEKLAQVYAATDREELARTHADRALAIYRAAPGVDPAWIETVEGILSDLP